MEFSREKTINKYMAKYQLQMVMGTMKMQGWQDGNVPEMLAHSREYQPEDAMEARGRLKKTKRQT